jgi:hypothetical protein
MPLALTLASLFAPVANRNRHADHRTDREQFEDARLGECNKAARYGRTGYKGKQQGSEC